MISSRWPFAALFVLALSTTALAQGVAGTWAASFDTQIGVQEYIYEFQIDGTTLKGMAKSANGEVEITEGKIEGNEISFVENLNYQGMPLRIVYTGTLEGDELHLTRDVAGIAMEQAVAKRPE